MKLLPPKTKLVGRDQVADTHASQRGDKARKLARAARMLWLQLQAKTFGDPYDAEQATATLPVGGGCGAPCRNPLQWVRATEPQQGGGGWLDPLLPLMTREARLSPQPSESWPAPCSVSGKRKSS